MIGFKLASWWSNIQGRKIFTGKHPARVRLAGILLMAGGLVALMVAGYSSSRYR